MSNRNKITCECENFISYMLLQPDINKWGISQVKKLDKLYINSASDQVLQIFKNDFIQ